MKKMVYIGVPLAVVAIIVTMAVKNPSNTDTKMAHQDSSSHVETVSSGNSNNSAQTEISSPQVNPNRDTSIDGIVDSLLADATSDAYAIASEANDEASLQKELQDYNNLKTTDYENSI